MSKIVTIELDLSIPAEKQMFDAWLGPVAPPEYTNAVAAAPPVAPSAPSATGAVATLPPVATPPAPVAPATVAPMVAPQPSVPAPATVPAPEPTPPATVAEGVDPRKQLSDAMMSLFRHDAKLGEATSTELTKTFGKSDPRDWTDEQVGQALTTVQSKMTF